MERLQPPTVLDEFRREPVEQLRVAGPLAVLSKIVRGLDQTHAKMMLPETVDDYSRREGMAGIDQPTRQIRPGIAAVGRQFGESLLDKHTQGAWCHGLA